MINNIINHVKARLGAYTRQLEISDEVIIQILEQETLPTLSIYFPYYLEWIIQISDEGVRVPDMQNAFYLPSRVEGHILMGVERVYPHFGNTQSTGLGNVYGGILPSLNNFISMKLDATMQSAFMVPNTFSFYAPNIVRLNGELNFTQYNKFASILKVTHNVNFSTFPFGLREKIMKLAFYDVCLDILGIRKYFSNLGTTFGSIELNLDVLDVSDKRDELIEDFRKNQLKNSLQQKIWIA